MKLRRQRLADCRLKEAVPAEVLYVPAETTGNQTLRLIAVLLTPFFEFLGDERAERHRVIHDDQDIEDSFHVSSFRDAVAVTVPYRQA